MACLLFLKNLYIQKWWLITAKQSYRRIIKSNKSHCTLFKRAWFDAFKYCEKRGLFQSLKSRLRIGPFVPLPNSSTGLHSYHSKDIQACYYCYDCYLYLHITSSSWEKMTATLLTLWLVWSLFVQIQHTYIWKCISFTMWRLIVVETAGDEADVSLYCLFFQPCQGQRSVPCLRYSTECSHKSSNPDIVSQVCFGMVQMAQCECILSNNARVKIPDSIILEYNNAKKSDWKSLIK